MPRTLKKLCVLTSAATLLGCASYPCETERVQPGATVISGAENLKVTCAGGAQHSVFVSSATFLQPSYSPEPGLDVFFFALNPDTQKASLGFDLFFPQALADGTYTVGGAADSTRVSSRGDAQAQFQGTLSFERTRNVPLIDEPEPKEGVKILSTLELTVDLTGKLQFDASCGAGSFSTGPLVLHLERTSEVGTCRDDWGGPRLGH